MGMFLVELTRIPGIAYRQFSRYRTEELETDKIPKKQRAERLEQSKGNLQVDRIGLPYLWATYLEIESKLKKEQEEDGLCQCKRKPPWRWRKCR